MSNAIIGTGVLIQAGDGGGPEAFLTVAEIVSLKPPTRSRNEIDVSNHNEGQEAKILGMLRKGQPSSTVNWIPTNPTHAAIITDITNNTKRNWRILYPPSGLPRWVFPARVQMVDPQNITTDSPMQLNVNWTIDGAITEETV